ncbi:fibroleukin-like isoform X3 [Dreissena polymorpha]|nr:fibroleukin-like isoform X2 [Dreissena polymorpha]XP_052230477.1 fibroleukin-like isoform X3 [Dreissena polymorpha]
MVQRRTHEIVTRLHAELTDTGVHGLHGLFVHLTVIRHGLEHAPIQHRYTAARIAMVQRRTHEIVTRLHAELTDTGVHGLHGPYVHLTVTRHGLERATIQHRYTAAKIAMARRYKHMIVTRRHVDIFQRRFDGSVDFHRNFRNYEYGFGDVVGEHWLGLKYIYEITSNGYFQLRVNITRNDGRKAYDVYGNFRLQPGPRYTLNLGAQLKSHGVEPSSDTFFTTSSRTPVGSAFSTYDHDSDKFADGNCAELYKGGWWYNDCYMNINLNGLYQPGISKTTSMIYDGFPGLKSSTIMFKEIFKK